MLRGGAAFFCIEPRRLRGSGDTGGATRLRRSHRFFDDRCEFLEAVGNVPPLFSVPLTRNDEFPVGREPRLHAGQESSVDILREVRAASGVESQHGLAARAVDMLPPWARGTGKLPVDGGRRYHHPSVMNHDDERASAGHGGQVSGSGIRNDPAMICQERTRSSAVISCSNPVSFQRPAFGGLGPFSRQSTRAGPILSAFEAGDDCVVEFTAAHLWREMQACSISRSVK